MNQITKHLTTQNLEILKTALPNLSEKAAKAESQMQSIRELLAQALGALNKVQALSGDSVVKYTAGFEKDSELFVSAVQEITGPFEATCEYIEQLQLAMADLVVGIEAQNKTLEN